MLPWKAISQPHNSIYAKIDDHGIRQGNTGPILAQWQHPVASRVALDLPYWVMRSALYRLIRMAIETARDAGAFFSVVDFMSCSITVAKQPCYGRLKIKPRYYCSSLLCVNLVCILWWFLTEMSAVLAIIANDGQAIVVIDREAVVINYFSFSLFILLKPFDRGLGQSLPQRLLGAGYAWPTKPCRWRGKHLYPGGDVCVLVFL